MDYKISIIIMNSVNSKFNELCNTKSDINEHLPTLYKYAQDCESIFETGVRGCISSWAFVNGLLKNGKSVKKIFMNDISECDIAELLNVTSDLPIKVDYKWINNLELDLPYDVDMTFIDTLHVYGQLKRELNKFSKQTKKYIIMHDTTVDGVHGESVRQGYNPYEISKISNIPVEEIQCGLQKAIDEFLLNNTDWTLDLKYINNNGLTILKRI